MHEVIPNRGRDNGKADLNSIPDVFSGGRDSAFGDGHGFSYGNVSRIAEDIHGDSGTGESLLEPSGASEIVPRHPPHSTPFASLLGLPPPPPAPPSGQQSSSGSVIRWERFLPFQSLKVLLVEYDDSTRHVLSALLRNCSYEVTAVANGLEAWKILEDLSNHVDIVLTEVVMPGLSGMGLLYKIINHKTYQNIPVIMMSSHDSMGLVLKCLSKGAVDFLIKPIRKNELKNLWQHVWRRCHSSSGSGSESGIQTQKSVKHRYSDKSGSDCKSDPEYEDTSIDLNMQDGGSDNGSGTQSYWRSHTAESPQPVSPSNWLAEPYNSTCAQVIHRKTETFCNEWVTETRSKDCEEKEILDQDSLWRDSKFGMPGEQDSTPKTNRFDDVHYSTLGSLTDIYTKAYLPRNNLDQDKSGKETINTSPQVTPMIRTIIDPVYGKILNTKIEVSDETNMDKNKDKTICNMKGSPSQVNMKILTYLGECGTVSCNEQNLPRNSGLSAFTRYNTSAASNQVPQRCLGKHSRTDNINSEAIKIQFLSTDTALNHDSTSNNHNMVSSTQNVSTELGGNMKSVTQIAVKGSCSPAFHPSQKENPLTEEALKKKTNHFEADSSGIASLPKGFHHVELEQHSNCRSHHVHNMQQLPPLEHHEHASKNIEGNVPECGSSNAFSGELGLNTGNYSVNGSVSGSNHVSNALNCSSSPAIDVERGNIDDGFGLAGKCGVGCGTEDQSGGRSASVVNQYCCTQRAVLNKFRQKRKDRCFEKKVQYQNRKRLAEQRPHFHGQFVRQPTLHQDNSDS